MKLPLSNTASISPLRLWLQDFHLIVGNVPYQANGHITAKLSEKYHIHPYLLRYKGRRTAKTKVHYPKTLELLVIHYIFSSRGDINLSVGVAVVGIHYHFMFPLLQVLTNHNAVSFQPHQQSNLSNISKHPSFSNLFNCSKHMCRLVSWSC